MKTLSKLLATLLSPLQGRVRGVFLSLLLLATLLTHGQTLYNPAVLGQTTRNQKLYKGLQIEDTLLAKGKVFFKGLSALTFPDTVISFYQGKLYYSLSTSAYDFYFNDYRLSSNRTVDGNNKSLQFNNLSAFGIFNGSTFGIQQTTTTSVKNNSMFGTTGIHSLGLYNDKDTATGFLSTGIIYTNGTRTAGMITNYSTAGVKFQMTDNNPAANDFFAVRLNDTTSGLYVFPSNNGGNSHKGDYVFRVDDTSSIPTFRIGTLGRISCPNMPVDNTADSLWAFNSSGLGAKLKMPCTRTEWSYVSGVTSAIQTQIDAKSSKLITANRQTASYTLVLVDAGLLVEMNVGSSNNLTVPPNSDVAFSVGTQILISQYGAGQTTVVAGSGVTIRSNSGKLKLTGQYSGATLIKIGTNEWYLFGDISS